MFATLYGLKTIAPRKLHEQLERGTVTVVDVNVPASWHSARVPGATRLDPLAFNESDLPAAKDAPLVFYCSNPLCRKAPHAARRAQAMGYTDVRVLSAGIRGWLGANLPYESGGESDSPGASGESSA